MLTRGTLMLAVVLLAAVGGCVQATPTPQLRFPGRLDAQPRDIELVVGESALLEGMKLSVPKVERMQATSAGVAEFGMEYLIVGVHVENADRKTRPYSSLNFRVLTAGGRVLRPSLEQVEQSLGTGELVSGGGVEGNVVFEVPVEVGHQYLIYDPAPSDMGRIVVRVK